MATGLTMSADAQSRNAIPADLGVTLKRIGDRMEEYYAKARSIICLETVRLQPLASSLAPDGYARRLEYELRVAWESSPDGVRPPDATVLRQLLRVDGRPPKPADEPGCMDPKPVSPEPLAMLLSNRQGEYVFSWAGSGRTDGRQSVSLEYKPIARGPADVTWKGECVTVSLPGRARGRVWVDAATSDVLRFDEQLTGIFEFAVPKEHTRLGSPQTMMVERSDTSIRYKAVAFRNPEETLMLPSSIESVTIIRNAGVPRLRTTQVFSDYRRFVTGARVVDDRDGQ